MPVLDFENKQKLVLSGFVNVYFFIFFFRGLKDGLLRSGTIVLSY